MATDDELAAVPSPQPMLTVAAVARRLGVAPSTLRTWDRRYGLGPSAHTAGSHRRYSTRDLERLVVMRGLTLEGVPPGEAAQIARSGPLARLSVTARPAPAPGSPPSDADPHTRSNPQITLVAGIPPARYEWAPQDRREASDGSAGPHPAGPHPAGPHPAGPYPAADHITRYLHPGPGEPSPAADRGPRAGTGRLVDTLWPELLFRPGGGRVMSLPDGSRRARGLARAALSLDTREVNRLLSEAIAGSGVVSVWETMVLPVLQAIGERWRLSGDVIDVEHAFSETVLGVLHGVTATVATPRNTCPILLSCAQGDEHTLPLHALAAALAEEEVGCRMLGRGMPPEALVAAVRRTGPAAVFVYALLPVGCAAVLQELPRQRPAPRVVIGGPGWAGLAPAGPAVVRVDSLGQAVEEMLAAVHV